ncbi:MAG: PQQ-dependent sugar dehydrogenase [Mycobacteriales bacterium]
MRPLMFARTLLAASTLAVGTTVLLAGHAAAATPTLPAGFSLTDTASGQDAYDLTDFAYLPNDGGILTTGKHGRVTWMSPSGAASTIATVQVTSDGDLGLVGLALDKDYATNHYVYTTTARPVGGGTSLRLSRWTVTGTDHPTGLTAEQTLLEYPAVTNVHGLWDVEVAGDGTLWVSSGDSGNFGGVDPDAVRTYDLNGPYGKLMHLRPDGTGVPSNPYFDPANAGSWKSRVFAYGFRSPFRLSLDPASGVPILGDVGWNTWEEINLVHAGTNYGWPCFEGFLPAGGYTDLAACNGVQGAPPLLAFHHGTANCIIGGIVYTGDSYPEQYRGAYFFGDYTAAKLWTAVIKPDGTLARQPEDGGFASDIGNVVKIGAASNGDIVFADITTGKLRRLSYTAGDRAPTAVATATSDPSSLTVSFDGSQSYDLDRDPITYQWDFGDGSTGTGATPTHTYAAPGDQPVTATLTVTDTFGKTGTTHLTVVPSNHVPAITAQFPSGGATYAVGDTVSLSATATDTEDGTLPVHWTSYLLHCHDTGCHVHPGVDGDGATFSTPFPDHGADDIRLVVTATATDSRGAVATSTYTAVPRLHTLRLASNLPATIRVGDEATTEVPVTAGATITVDAAAVAADGVATFDKWIDSGAPAQRQLTMPDSDLTLTANYLTPIDQRYNNDTAFRTLLGAPTGLEVTDGPTHWRPYANGRAYWSAAGGVHEVHGPILTDYLAVGGHVKLGAPKTDQAATTDGTGQYNDFVGGGSVYWSQATGAHAVYGIIGQEWVAIGGEPVTGFPTTDETGTPDGGGRYNHFAGGYSIYFTPGTGAHEVHGFIRDHWAALGWERATGYPTTDESVTPNGVGRYNHFSGGWSIYYSPSTGAHDVHGLIRDQWAALGWEAGVLGFPTTDETGTPDGIGRYNHFSNGGSIYFTPGTGAHEVYGAIRQLWASMGWERSWLGYPTSGEFDITGGRRENFQHGYITWGAGGAVAHHS